MNKAIKVQNTCKCTCKQTVNKNYRPGHDAVHVSLMHKQILRSLFEVNCNGLALQAAQMVLDESFYDLPTVALRAKLLRMVANDAELMNGLSDAGLDIHAGINDAG